MISDKRTLEKIEMSAYNSSALKVEKGWFLIGGDAYTPDLIEHLDNLNMLTQHNEYMFFFKDLDKFFSYRRKVSKKYFMDEVKTIRHQDLVLSDYKCQKPFFNHEEMTYVELIEKYYQVDESTRALAEEIQKTEESYLSGLSPEQRSRLSIIPKFNTKEAKSSSRSSLRKV